MPQTIRTFIAIEIPEARRDDLDRLRSRLAPKIPTARWVSRSQYHVTLAFLGDIQVDQIERITGAVSDASKGFEPIALHLGRIGAFPDDRRPRVLWVGLEGPGLAALGELHQSLSRALSDSGHPPDTHGRFTPHVTLARFKTGPGRARPPDLHGILPALEPGSDEPFEIAEIVTYASELRPEGPDYHVLGRSRLERL